MAIALRSAVWQDPDSHPLQCEDTTLSVRRDRAGSKAQENHNINKDITRVELTILVKERKGLLELSNLQRNTVFSEND